MPKIHFTKTQINEDDVEGYFDDEDLLIREDEYRDRKGRAVHHTRDNDRDDSQSRRSRR